jgi:hypothetical protein
MRMGDANACTDLSRTCPECRDSLRLCAGDPGKAPATYTRFVLPFAYKLNPSTPVDPTQHYYIRRLLGSETEKDIDIWRRRYLTDETEEVLFQRASWFELNISDKQISMTFDDKNRSLLVWLKPPRLVLFEYPATNTEQSSDHDILRSGFLIQDVYFDANSRATFDDLLKMNELFRYWQRPFLGHESVGGYTTLLQNLQLSLENVAKTIGNASEEDDIYFDRWANLLNYPIQFDSSYFSIVTDKSMNNARKKASGKYINDKEWDGDSGWLVYADNRTFVWTCAIMKNGAQAINFCYGNDSTPDNAADYCRWVRLLNVDQPSGHLSDFERNWANERTFKRWGHMGALNGFSYHSGAMLASNCRNPELWKNFGAMYFDQTLLLLYLRVSLFRFSVLLNKISAAAIDNNDGDKKWVDEFRKLRWSFSLFANLYQFPLLSNQQQGLEMYTMQRKYMEIDDLFKEIKEEIHGSYEFLVVQQDLEQTEQGERLNVVATIGLVGALAFSFLGMNVLVGEYHPAWHDFKHWSLVIFTVIVFWCITTLILFYSRGLSGLFSKLAKCGEKESETICKILKGDMK